MERERDREKEREREREVLKMRWLRIFLDEIRLCLFNCKFIFLSHKSLIYFIENKFTLKK